MPKRKITDFFSFIFSIWKLWIT